jgi:hypothetical protein
MILLTSTSDIIRVVTGAAVSTITVHASYVDNASGTITPARTNTNITTATTTTVVASPAASTQRNVRTLGITNNSSSASTQVTVQHFDGATSTDLMGVTLLPGENLVLSEEGQWEHHDAQGAAYTPTLPNAATLGGTGAIAENVPRYLAGTATTAGTSGTVYLAAVYLYAGQLVSNITITTGGTAFTTPTNQFFGLYSGNPTAPALLATSANQTTTALPANTVKTLAMTTPYRVPTSGIYYVAFMVTATTMGTLNGPAALTQATDANRAPILFGSSSTGQTTALPTTGTSILSNTTAARFRVEIS